MFPMQDALQSASPMQTAETCRHHWVIESPHGSPTVRGQCKLCGATRTYPTFAEEKQSLQRWQHPVQWAERKDETDR